MYSNYSELKKQSKKESKVMNYKELQAEVKRLAELTGLPCPALNKKKVELESDLCILQSTYQLQADNTCGKSDAIVEVEVEVPAEALEVETVIVESKSDSTLWGWKVTKAKITNSSDVATVLVETTIDSLEVAAIVTKKLGKIVLGTTVLTLLAVAYLTYSLGQYLAPRIKRYFFSVALPSGKLLIKQAVHRCFYYSQKGYGEVRHLKALVTNAPFFL